MFLLSNTLYTILNRKSPVDSVKNQPDFSFCATLSIKGNTISTEPYLLVVFKASNTILVASAISLSSYLASSLS